MEIYEFSIENNFFSVDEHEFDWTQSYKRMGEILCWLTELVIWFFFNNYSITVKIDFLNNLIYTTFDLLAYKF